MQFYRLKFLLVLHAILVLYASVLAQPGAYASRVLEYKPAPGQFINTSVGCPYAAQSVLGGLSGMLSLGGWGGYLVLGFDHSIENHPDNPYGVDFAIVGNANVSSSEPAAVYVMTDSNQNGQADETWFLLAGSDFYFSNSDRQYQITYQNPGADSAAPVKWTDKYGNSGFIEHNSFHAQPYYPSVDSFPDINYEAYTLNGLLIQSRLNTQNESYITSQHYPFGFADNTLRNTINATLFPDNPYTSQLEGLGGDSFDISWAVDADGNAVNIQAIDFVKIQTAVNASAGWLGEISTEISGLIDIAPDASITGEMRKLVLEPFYTPLDIAASYACHVLYFIEGTLQAQPALNFWTSDSQMATVDNDGNLYPHMAGEVWLYVSLETDASIRDSMQLKVGGASDLTLIETTDFVVFPNPVQNYFKVACSQPITRVDLFNSLGERLFLNQLGPDSFDTGHLPFGIYILKVQIGTMQIVKKIVKS